MIGEQAAGKEDSISYFKDNPEYFEEMIEGHTKKELMQDYLTELMRILFLHNTDTLNGWNPRCDEDDKRALLLVGCPSSNEGWLNRKEDYAAMISEAVNRCPDIPKTEVIVLPESRAAIMSALSQKKWITVRQGVLVLDFGSSTLDATWLESNKKPLERSWRLGASEVERFMLDLILKDNGYGKEDLTDVQVSKLNYAYRMSKERFFSDKASESPVIIIYNRDENGNTIMKVNSKGIKKPSLTILEQDVDEEFMDRVLKDVKFSLRDREQKLSWCEHCRLCLQEMKNVIVENNFDCNSVIITGGASAMGVIVEICHEVFEGMRILQTENPSMSVSRGLAQSAHNDLQAEYIRDELQSSSEISVNTILDNYVNEAAKDIATFYGGKVLPVIEGWAQPDLTGDDTSIQHLNDLVCANLKKMTNDDLLAYIKNNSFESMTNKVKLTVRKQANDKLSEIYHNRIGYGSLLLEQDAWETIVRRWRLEDIFKPENTALDFTYLMTSFFTDICILLLQVVNPKKAHQLFLKARNQPRSAVDRMNFFDRQNQCFVEKKEREIRPVLAKIMDEAKTNYEIDVPALVSQVLDAAFDQITFYA